MAEIHLPGRDYHPCNVKVQDGDGTEFEQISVTPGVTCGEGIRAFSAVLMRLRRADQADCDPGGWCPALEPLKIGSFTCRDYGLGDASGVIACGRRGAYSAAFNTDES